MVSDRHIVSVDEVAELLRKAKAPVLPADALYDLADAMTMMGARYLYGRNNANIKPPGALVLTLKDGRMIAPRSQRAHSRALAQIRAKGLPLPQGPMWPDPKSGKRPSAWHLEAEFLWRLYCRDVNTAAGRWRDGPPLRFLELALARVGLGSKRVGRTIEEALKRAAKRRAAKK
jgi:hypothetical protein